MSMNWQDIIGHVNIINNLRRLTSEDKMPHALLFIGIDGIGKFLAGEILAKTLLCNDGTDMPCGSCRSCQAVDSNIHPDLFVLEPDGKTVQMIKIEQIRQMRSNIALAPYLSDKRVVIIRDADKMNEAAANGLLKTLEEPIGRAFFILTASNEKKMLPTILSRCMKVYFSPLRNSDIESILQSRGLENTRALTIARLSGGSAGQALLLHEHDGLKNRADAYSFLTQVLSFSDEDIWMNADKLAKTDREKLSEWVFYLQMFWRDIVVLYHNETDSNLYDIDLKEQLIQQKSVWLQCFAFQAADYAAAVQHRLQTNTDIRLTMEAFIIKLRDLIRS